MAETKFAAAHKALSLPELVEPILLHAPLRTILLARRVCCTWNSIFTHSWDIQRALFLTTTEHDYYLGPSQDPEAIEDMSEGGMFESQTMEHCAIQEHGTEHVEDDACAQQSGPSRRPILNPFLFLLKEATEKLCSQRRYGTNSRHALLRAGGTISAKCLGNGTLRLNVSDFTDLRGQVEQSEASFKKMLILDLPLYHLRLAESYAWDNFGNETAKDPITAHSDWPFTIDELLLHADYFISDGCEWADVGDSRDWLILGDSVDEITGYRMLEMLDADHEAVSTAIPSSAAVSSGTQIPFGSNAKWLHGEG